MTLTKHGVWKQALCSLEKVFDKSSSDVELVYKCADVDRVVEELRATVQKREDSLVVVHGQRDKAQADLARVTAELEQIKSRRVLPIDPYTNTVNTVPEK